MCAIIFYLLQRVQFLKDALADICDQPSETDLMKAALAVLKVSLTTLTPCHIQHAVLCIGKLFHFTQ